MIVKHYCIEGGFSIFLIYFSILFATLLSRWIEWKSKSWLSLSPSLNFSEVFLGRWKLSRPVRVHASTQLRLHWTSAVLGAFPVSASVVLKPNLLCEWFPLVRSTQSSAIFLRLPISLTHKQGRHRKSHFYRIERKRYIPSFKKFSVPDDLVRLSSSCRFNFHKPLKVFKQLFSFRKRV